MTLMEGFLKEFEDLVRLTQEQRNTDAVLRAGRQVSATAEMLRRNKEEILEVLDGFDQNEFLPYHVACDRIGPMLEEESEGNRHDDMELITAAAHLFDIYGMSLLVWAEGRFTIDLSSSWS